MRIEAAGLTAEDRNPSQQLPANHRIHQLPHSTYLVCFIVLSTAPSSTQTTGCTSPLQNTNVAVWYEVKMTNY